MPGSFGGKRWGLAQEAKAFAVGRGMAIFIMGLDGSRQALSRSPCQGRAAGDSRTSFPVPEGILRLPSLAWASCFWAWLKCAHLLPRETWARNLV